MKPPSRSDSEQATLRLASPGGAFLLEVHVSPRASKTALIGLHDGRLNVALEAPPVDGAANAALVHFFAKALRLRQSDVTVVRGHKSRQKTLQIERCDEATLRALCQL